MPKLRPNWRPDQPKRLSPSYSHTLQERFGIQTRAGLIHIPEPSKGLVDLALDALGVPDWAPRSEVEPLPLWAAWEFAECAALAISAPRLSDVCFTLEYELQRVEESLHWHRRIDSETLVRPNCVGYFNHPIVRPIEESTGRDWALEHHHDVRSVRPSVPGTRE